MDAHDVTGTIERLSIGLPQDRNGQILALRVAKDVYSVQILRHENGINYHERRLKSCKERLERIEEDLEGIGDSE